MVHWDASTALAPSFGQSRYQRLPCPQMGASTDSMCLTLVNYSMLSVSISASAFSAAEHVHMNNKSAAGSGGYNCGNHSSLVEWHYVQSSFENTAIASWIQLSGGVITWTLVIHFVQIVGPERLLDVSIISFHISIDKYRYGLLAYRYIHIYGKMLRWKLASFAEWHISICLLTFNKHNNKLVVGKGTIRNVKG